MDFFAWLRLAARNRFAVAWRYWYFAFLITTIGAGHTALRGLQSLLFGRRIARTDLGPAPLFILGHWRTGTTLLHELLALDDRHIAPTTYDSWVPHHLLLTSRLGPPCLGWLLPSHRLVDNMTAGWDRPQEDEFALVMMGLPSPYQTILFPNRPPQGQGALDLEGLSAKELAGWKAGFVSYLKQLVCSRGGAQGGQTGRLVLKSPPHTCRIKVLLELFPDARFVYLVRNPYVVIPSTIHLWKTLYQRQGLQVPTYEGLQEHVISTFVQMDEKLEATRGLVGSERFVQLRYEELVQDPLGCLRRLYASLDLGDFDTVLPRVQAYLATTKTYRPNRYEEEPVLRDEITRRCAPFLQRYGYARQDAAVSSMNQAVPSTK
jgi:omega-hydroxy-beta-dihydromenaquinone-9 sulfotransferase